MTRRTIAWWVIGVPYFFVNLAGAVYAAVLGEGMHAGLHVGLVIVGVSVARRWMPRRWGGGAAATSEQPRWLPDRLTQLEQSIEAIAIEVERIGEGQRYLTLLFTERGLPRAASEDSGRRVDLEAR
jgi:GAF domain-containing protein